MFLAKTRAAGGRSFPRLPDRMTALAMLTVSVVIPQLVCTASLKAEPRDHPNIVFILADDLGYGDVKCFGGERCQIDTPAFDRLASEGMRFTDAHANASVCVPTRVAIMTGRYPWRFGPPDVGGPWGFLGTRFSTEQYTLGDLMQSAGYQTAYIGKWHLGTSMQTTDGKVQGPGNVDYTKPLYIGPPQFGFEYSFILPGSLDMYPYAFVRNNQWVGDVTAQKGWSAFNRVGPAAEDFEDTKVLETFSGEAEKFISNAAGAAGGQPFFLYFALTSPHTPTCPSEKFRGKSKLGIYGDFVMETDHCIARILETLDDLSLADNTLVIATSDHGPAPYAGRIAKATFAQLKELEKDGHYSAGSYRGYKFSAYEGGLRVPFVARWPGHVPAGTTCDRLIGLPDMMATLAEIAGVDLNESQAVDSFSILPLLKDPQHQPVRESMILQSTRAMVVRSGQWKLLLCPGSGSEGRFGNSPASQQAWRDAVESFGRKPKSHKELLQPPFLQLYDLSNDPGEQRNVAADHPEIIAKLVALLQRNIDSGRSSPGEQQRNENKNIKLFNVPPFVWK